VLITGRDDGVVLVALGGVGGVFGDVVGTEGGDALGRSSRVVGSLPLVVPGSCTPVAGRFPFAAAAVCDADPGGGGASGEGSHHGVEVVGG